MLVLDHAVTLDDGAFLLLLLDVPDVLDTGLEGLLLFCLGPEGGTLHTVGLLVAASGTLGTHDQVFVDLGA